MSQPANTVGVMAEVMTAGQERVVAHAEGLLRIRGGAGAGKTTALVGRYLRLAAQHGAHRVLVLARNRAAALRFSRAVRPHVDGSFAPLAVTTPWGLALRMLRRRGQRPRILDGAEEWGLVRELLAAEAGDGRLWPSLSRLVGRRAFVDEVVAALRLARAAGLGPVEVRAAAAAHPAPASRWAEVAGFFERYLSALEARDVRDGDGVVAEAAAALQDPGAVEEEWATHPWVLVDDYEAATPAVNRLVSALAGPENAGLTVVGNPDLAVESSNGLTPASFEGLRPAVEVVLDRVFRRPEDTELVRCGHPSMEAEAVAGELLAARASGVPWDEMAVLVPGPGSRAAAIGRALARHQVPVAPQAGRAGDEPVVRGLVELLRWVHGDTDALDRLLGSPLADLDAAEARRVRQEAARSGAALESHPALAGLVSTRDTLSTTAANGDAAAVAYQAFRLGLAHLVRGPADRSTAAEDRALDAVGNFLDGVNRYVAEHPGARLAEYLARLDAPAGGPDPWAPARQPPGTVPVVPISACAGREWHTVVVAGCVEGELPRVDDGMRYFDPAVLGAAPAAPAERRLESLRAQRRLFTLARSRATRTLVAVAAPEPGVLLSRFVEDWPARGPRLPMEQGPAPPTLGPTAGRLPMWPEDALSLSATQLDTYEDCPLKHAYRYGLGVRGQSGVHANLGSLVHQVLERFCDPNDPVEAGSRSLERLHQLAEECWSDDLAPYRPQLEEARRDLFAMLDLWWEKEGAAAPSVVATEHPFQVEVGPHHLSGRIDRVDRVEDDEWGGGGGLRVVDYKSGKTKPKAADVAGDLQLATYHLGASRDPELAALGPVRELRLLHLRTMTAFEQEITPGHERATEERVRAVARRIKAEELGPDAHADCDHCELHRLCPLWPEGQEAGQEGGQEVPQA